MASSTSAAMQNPNIDISGIRGEGNPLAQRGGGGGNIGILSNSQILAGFGYWKMEYIWGGRGGDIFSLPRFYGKPMPRIFPTHLLGRSIFSGKPRA